MLSRFFHCCTFIVVALLPIFVFGSNEHQSPRLVLYMQTTHDSNGNSISLLPLIKEQGISLTHLIISTLHFHEDSEIHLNDLPPSDKKFSTLWDEAEQIKATGVTIMTMIGGSARGAFSKSALGGDDATFESHYKMLQDVLVKQKIQGIDLDVEEPMTQDSITRLIKRFRSDLVATLSSLSLHLLRLCLEVLIRALLAMRRWNHKLVLILPSITLNTIISLAIYQARRGMRLPFPITGVHPRLLQDN